MLSRNRRLRKCWSNAIAIRSSLRDSITGAIRRARKRYVQKKILSQSSCQSHDSRRQCFLRSDPQHRKQCRPTAIRMKAWPSSIPPKIGSKAGVFHNVSSNPRLHAGRPVGTCNRRWRLPLNQTQKLTCNNQSDMFAQCTCNATKNCFKHNRKAHAAKLSTHSLFFLTSFSLFFLLKLKLPKALAQFWPKRSRFKRFLK